MTWRKLAGGVHNAVPYLALAAALAGSPECGALLVGTPLPAVAAPQLVAPPVAPAPAAPVTGR